MRRVYDWLIRPGHPLSEIQAATPEKVKYISENFKGFRLNVPGRGIIIHPSLWNHSIKQISVSIKTFVPLPVDGTIRQDLSASLSAMRHVYELMSSHSWSRAASRDPGSLVGIVHKSLHGQIKNRFLHLVIVSGFVDLFKTTSNFYIAHKTSYEKNAMRRLMNDIN